MAKFLTISGDDAKTCHRMLRGNKGRNGKPKTGLALTREEHRVGMRKVATADSIETLAGFREVAEAACPKGYKLGKPLTKAQRNADYDLGIWVNASHAPGLRYVAYVKFASQDDGGYLQPAQYHTCMGPGESVGKLLGSEFKLAKDSACAKALAKSKAEAKAKAKPKASAKTRKATSKAKADAVAKGSDAERMASLREIVAMFPGCTVAEAKSLLDA